MATARTDKVVMNFTGGEITPLLDGRTDVERVVNGCRTLKNMVIDDAGAAVRRRGFRYVASQKGAGLPPTPTGFIGETDEYVAAIAIDGDDLAYIGGAFTEVNGNAGFPYLARLTQYGVIDPTFNPVVNAPVAGIKLISGGRILIWGSFTSINSTARDNVAILNDDGTLDAFSCTVTGAAVSAADEISTGKILLGFPTASGNVNGNAITNYIVALNADGTTYATFAPTIVSAYSVGIYEIYSRPDGRVMLGGGFDTVNSATHRALVCLETDGTTYATFDSDIHRGGSGGLAVVHDCKRATDGNLIIVGQFTTIFDGSVNRSRARMAKLDYTTGVLIGSATFTNAGFSATVYYVEEVSGGKFIASGDFVTVSTGTIDQIARIGSDGNPDLAWPDLATSPGNTPVIAKFSDDSILCGLYVPHTIGGVSRNGLAKLNTSGAVIANA